MEAFYRTAAFGDPIESNSHLVADVMAAICSGYVSAGLKDTEVMIQNL